MKAELFDFRASKGTWILVAHRSGARLYETRYRPRGVHLLREFPNPEGRLQEREMGADRPGRTYTSLGLRSAMDPQTEFQVQVAQSFARKLSEVLEQGRTSNQFDRLWLVAEPSFLGLLRANLSDVTAKCVVGSETKDLHQVPEHQMRRSLDFVFERLAG